jgi:hypothetical protein
MVDMKEAKRDTERVLDLLYATQVFREIDHIGDR